MMYESLSLSCVKRLSPDITLLVNISSWPDIWNNHSTLDDAGSVKGTTTFMNHDLFDKETGGSVIYKTVIIVSKNSF